jgi:hypothetical protein
VRINVSVSDDMMALAGVMFSRVKRMREVYTRDSTMSKEQGRGKKMQAVAVGDGKITLYASAEDDGHELESLSDIWSERWVCMVDRSLGLVRFGCRMTGRCWMRLRCHT